jgi:DnaJ family protein A protein 5
VRAEEENRLRAERNQRIQEEVAELQRGMTFSVSEDALLYLNEFDQTNKEEGFNCDYCKRTGMTEKTFRQHCTTKKHSKAIATAQRNFRSNISLFPHTVYTFVLLYLSSIDVERITGESIDLATASLREDENTSPSPSEEAEDMNDEEKDEAAPQKFPQLTKKQKKDIKKQKSESQKKNTKITEEAEQLDPPPKTHGSAFSCKKCKTDFSSKNQLFKHLKETGHAVFK